MKSIKFKILTLAMSLALVSIVAISITSIFGTYNSTMFALEESMMSTIDATADMVEIQLESYKDMARQLAVDEVLSQETPGVGEVSADGRTYQQVKNEIVTYIEELRALHGYDAVQIFDKEGVAFTINTSLAEEAYFKVPKETGEAYIGDPVISPESGLLTMTISTPIIKNGQFEGVALLAVNPKIFSDIVSKVSVGHGSTTTIINKEGTTIAYNDIQLVTDQYNTTEEAKTDSSLKVLAELEQDLASGNSGFTSVTWEGKGQFAAYTPIDGSNGWGIYTMALQSDFLGQMTDSIITVVVLSIVILIIAVFITIIVARNISNPITLCAERLNGVAAGDLKSPMPSIKTNDETGILAQSTETIVNTMSIMIEDLNNTLSEIASGNFAVKSKARDCYIGDFSTLRESLIVIVEKLSSTMYRINDVSNQVNSGNGQVAQGAQSLAQGSIEQASAIEQLSETIAEITMKIDETANDSQTAKQANEKSQQALCDSNDQMKKMVAAMANISDKSIEISNIIKTIDDIAFQTNILSLNAAVEAARAGAAGKGFAVVADEVRNLATKSAQSAKDTATLIEETVAAVENGNKIVNSTSKSINVAIQSANELSSLVDGIATISVAQAEGAKQVHAGIEQISAVVQMNSATAEESAATSEELSGQSHILKELLSGFKLHRK